MILSSRSRNERWLGHRLIIFAGSRTSIVSGALSNIPGKFLGIMNKEKLVFITSMFLKKPSNLQKK